MNIRIEDNGTVWVCGIPTPGETIQPPTMEHPANAAELVTYATEIAAARDALADMPRERNVLLRAVVKALVKTINLRLPAGNKITAEELKQAIKDEL